MLHKYHLFARWLVVAVDGAGVMNCRERHGEHGLHRTSKSDVTTYFHPVLARMFHKPDPTTPMPLTLA